jgi:acetoin utilization protein AcuB
MLVKNFMTRHPVMVSPTTPASEAQKVMRENKIRHLPVVGDGKRLVGLITRERLGVSPTDLGSLNVWEITRYLSNLTVKDMMLKREDVITIEPDAALEEAAQIMAKHKIGCLVVLEENVVVGIITETDMLVQLNDLLGGGVAGVRVTIRVPDKVGEFTKVTSAIASHGWGIYASGSVPAPKHPGYWDLVVKVRGVPKDDLVAVLEKIEGQEIIDARQTT